VHEVFNFDYYSIKGLNYIAEPWTHTKNRYPI